MSTSRWRGFFCALTLLAAKGSPSAQAAPAAAAKPRLVVLLSVDQMRGDYPRDFGRQWSKGLKRLFSGGAEFVNTRYPYLHTVTCAGHATIGTGAFPRTHGMVFNGWWVDGQKRVVPCTEDPSAKNVVYLNGGPTPKISPGHSAHQMQVPTLAEAMKASLKPAARVFSASFKPRSAIGLVGKGGDVVTFFDQGSYVTSTVYSSERNPTVTKVLAGFAPEKVVRRPWTRFLPVAAYRGDDGESFERVTVPYWTNTLPKSLLPGASAAVPAAHRPAPAATPGLQAWAESPFPDEVLLALARAGLGELRLGRGQGTDLLAVSFSALDTVGHSFGPRSHEVQDALARLDALLGELLSALDRSVGRGRYVLALTADHGVAPYPEDLAASGKDAGRVSGSEVKKRVEAAVAAELGPGSYVASVLYTDVYLVPGVFEKLRARPGALGRIKTAIAGVPGLVKVFSDDELRDPARLTDPLAKAAALSHFPGRSGHLVMIPRAHWLTTSTGTTHGTHHDYDQHVPLVLYGAGIRPGRYEQPATPADVAPTLAALVGVPLPTADGRVLKEALTK